ncbi:MAG: hypothetical protein ABEJ93_01575 [Candidatus Nanohalobium sp.]
MALAAYFKLRSSFREKGVDTLKYFSKVFGMFALFMLIQGMPFFVPYELSSVQLGSFFIFGHIFLYGSYAFLVQVPLSIYRPEWKKYGFWLSVVAGALVSFVNLLYWTEPTIEQAIVLFNVGAPVGPLIGVFSIAAMAVTAGGFFAKMAWQRSGRERAKFALLSLGMLILTAGGPLHDNATSIAMYIAADVLTVTGFTAIMSGLYIEWVAEKLGF